MLFGCSDFNARNFALVCLLLHKSVFGVELGPSRPSKRDVSKAGHVGAAGDSSPSGREPHFDTLDRTEDVLGSLLKLALEGAVRQSQSNGPFSALAKTFDSQEQDGVTTPDDGDGIHGSFPQGDIGRKVMAVAGDSSVVTEISPPSPIWMGANDTSVSKSGSDSLEIQRNSTDSVGVSDKSGDNIGMLQQVVNQAYHNYNSHEDISNMGIKGQKKSDNNFQGIGRHSNDSFDAIHNKTGHNEGKVQQDVIDGHRTDGPDDNHKTDIMEAKNGDTDLPEFIPSSRYATATRSSGNERESQGKLDEPKDEGDIILFPDQINPTVDEGSDDDSLVETYFFIRAPTRDKTKPRCRPNERFFRGKCRTRIP
ncbi:uncharacterized protein LOC124162024 isoform X1 [Ischnura elegans]|uniref:uncharacterized protein LOC124162024 isoform X1 n=1 Tax=Ischnura elegans TaxID=197161 RepID=UPI001ED8A441|nr:uncharacterized protein LOC124162024 isoform X1 [Ischnura elegans]